MYRVKDFFRSKLDGYPLSALGLILILLIALRGLLSPGMVLNASDILTQDYFWHVFFQRQIEGGSPSFLTWNPYINGGTSFYGGLHLIFTPIALFTDFLFPPHMSIAVSALVHLFFAGFFTVLYARLIGLSSSASFFAGIFFIMSCQIMTLFNAGHILKLSTISYFPLVVFLLERAFIKKRYVDFVLVAVALSLQLYEAHIQISFYTCIFVALYFIWRSFSLYKEKRNVKELRHFYVSGTVMVLLFFTLSAATFNHWLEFKSQSDRSSGMTYELATNWSMSKKELLTYVVPQLFGLSRPNYKDPEKIKAFYWGKDLPFTQTIDYLGILPLVLAVFAILKSRNKYVKFFFCAVVLFQILGMGKYTPIYPFFYNYLGFKFFRVPKMILFIVAFATAILAAHGAEWLRDKLDNDKRDFLKKSAISVSLAGIFMIIVATVGELNQNTLIKNLYGYLVGHGRSFNPSLAKVRYEYSIEGIWIAAFLCFFAAGLIFLRLKEDFKPWVYFSLSLIFFFVDVSLVNFKFIDTVPLKDNVYISKDTATRFFEKDKGLYRVLNAISTRQSEDMVGYSNVNKYILYKVHSVTGYEAVQVTRYTDFLNKLNLSNQLIDLLNVKYVVLEKNGVKGTVGDRAGKFEIVVDEDVKILKNNSMLPRAFPVHRANIIKDGRMMQWLTNPGFDPSNIVLLESMPSGPLSKMPLPASASKVTIKSYGNEEIMLDVEMADNGFVVLSEKYYPGWNAYMNGEKVRVYPANKTLRAVYAPKGKSEIVFRYEPTANRLPLTISMVSFFAVGLFVVWSFFFRDKNKMGLTKVQPS